MGEAEQFMLLTVLVGLPILGLIAGILSALRS